MPSSFSTDPEFPHFTSNVEWALFWLAYGFQVIPIIPGNKIPALKLNPWLDGLSPEKIAHHWKNHPDHEVGCVVGDDLIVIDADGPESDKALSVIEQKFNCRPLLVIKTKRGYHHYFCRAPGTYAKADSHDSIKFPHRLDVKTGRSVVVLPPSTNKELHRFNASCTNELDEAPQDFIDAVFLHNDSPVPRLSLSSTDTPIIPEGDGDATLEKIKQLLAFIDPDCGYESWTRVLMGIYHETHGSDDGLALADGWSGKGSKYSGIREIKAKWRSFRADVPNPVTIATLIKLAREGGADVHTIMQNGDAGFEPCEYEVINPSTETFAKATDAEHPLLRFSLRGHSHTIEKQTVEQKPFLSDIALLGQATVIYAAPNTGKTLLSLHMLIDSISTGRVDPEKIFYVNVDDNGNGLLEKLRLAEEYAFHMLAEGHHDFKASGFADIMRNMTANNQAQGVIVILDTLKKFADLMDKGKASRFTEVMRGFVFKGGTVIALAHTNKNPGRDGKPVYGGTSDILDDVDCAYIMSTVSQDAASNQKTVEFTNIKRRGNVAQSAAYSYALESSISYSERIASVQPVDPMQLVPIKHAAQTHSDADVIAAVAACIKDGINSKMKLADAVAERVKTSKRTALKVIEQYTGNDPAMHKWTFDVRARGAQVFVLLPSPSPDQSG